MILTAGETIQKLIEMIDKHGDVETNIYMMIYNKEDNKVKVITDVSEVMTLKGVS